MRGESGANAERFFISVDFGDVIGVTTYFYGLPSK